MTTSTQPTRISEYVNENWQYFGRTWRQVSSAIQYYQSNPTELKNEQVGVNSFKDKETAQDRDASSVRILTAPNRGQFYGQLVDRIRQLHDLGADSEAIQRQIGPVPEISDVPGDLLSLNSIQAICGTAPKPMWARLAKAIK